MRRAPRCSRIVSITAARYSHASSACLGRRLDLGDRVDVHVEHAERTGLTGADAGTARAANDKRPGAVGEVARTLDRRDRADGGEPAVDAGDEHELVAGGLGGLTGPLSFVGLEGDRDHHLRQHDPLGQGQQGEQLSLCV